MQSQTEGSRCKESNNNATKKHCDVQIHDHDHDKTTNVECWNIPSPRRKMHELTYTGFGHLELKCHSDHHCHKNSIANLKYMNRIEECTDPEIRQESAKQRPRLDNSMTNDHTYENGFWVNELKDHLTKNKDKQHNATDLQHE